MSDVRFPPRAQNSEIIDICLNYCILEKDSGEKLGSGRKKMTQIKVDVKDYNLERKEALSLVMRIRHRIQSLFENKLVIKHLRGDEFAPESYLIFEARKRYRFGIIPYKQYREVFVVVCGFSGSERVVKCMVFNPLAYSVVDEEVMTYAEYLGATKILIIRENNDESSL